MTFTENITMSIIENELRTFGIEVKSGNSYRPFNEVILDIINKWTTMDNKQKQNIRNLLLKL